MAIDYRLAKAILQEHKYRPIEGTILLIGRQTVTMTPEQARALVKEEGLQVRPEALTEVDSETYGAAGRSLITDRAFFSLFSTATMISLDVSDYEGAQIVADLNQPIAEHYHNSADFIFNGSCMDNLFDPAGALKNMSRLLKPGGRVMHIEHGSPVQSAYIMYSPAYFFDYYAANHFADCKNYAMLFDHVLDAWQVFHWQGYAKQDGKWTLAEHMHSGWRNILNLVVAEKSAESTADATPIQGFYRQVHGTEHDLYFKACQRFAASKRPLLDLGKYAVKQEGAHPVGFSPLGVLEDPQIRQQSQSLAEIELARSFRQSNKPEQAIQAFTRAINFCDTVGMPGLLYVERGDMYAQLGDHAKALADFERAIQMNPDASFLARKTSMEKLVHVNGKKPGWWPLRRAG